MVMNNDEEDKDTVTKNTATKAFDTTYDRMRKLLTCACGRLNAFDCTLCVACGAPPSNGARRFGRSPEAEASSDALDRLLEEARASTATATKTPGPAAPEKMVDESDEKDDPPSAYEGSAGALRVVAETMALFLATSFLRFLPLFYGWRWFVAPMSPALDVSVGRIYGIAMVAQLIARGIGTVAEFDEVNRLTQEGMERAAARRRGPDENMAIARRGLLKTAAIAAVTLLCLWVVHRWLGG